MTREKSCGAVVFTKVDEQVRYLLVADLQGFFGFPKGHVEKEETEEETALREIREETGLKASLIDGFKMIDEYPLPAKKDTIKQVVFFLGTFQNQDLVFQKEELSNAVLVSYPEAMKLLQFENLRQILSTANAYVNAHYKNLMQ